MNREERIKGLAEKAKGQTVDCESAYYDCDGMCSPDNCIGHENGWAEFNGEGGEGELQIELGQLLAACEPEIMVAFCDIVASVRYHVSGKSGGDTLGSALARFDRLSKKS